MDAASVTTDAEQIHLELPVEHTKEVMLRVNLKAGGGAAQSNARVEIVPDRITVSGSAEAAGGSKGNLPGRGGSGAGAAGRGGLAGE